MVVNEAQAVAIMRLTFTLMPRSCPTLLLLLD
jgi:hypothetical protein